MGDLVVWTGPVATFHVAGATVAGADELFLNCAGDQQPGKPWCRAYGEQLQSDPGALYTRANVIEPEQLFLAGFSAGGHVLKRWLTNPDYRRDATFVHLADATYTASWVDPAQRIPPAIEGFVQYAVDVASGPGDQLFVATASPSPNKNWATGVENLQAIRYEVEQRTGRNFQQIDHFFGIEPGPERVYRLGNVIFAEYPMDPLGHDHPQIARQVWEQILHPWLAKGKGPVDSPHGIVNGIGPGPGPALLPAQPTSWDQGIGLLGIAAGVTLFVGGFMLVRHIQTRK